MSASDLRAKTHTSDIVCWWPGCLRPPWRLEVLVESARTREAEDAGGNRVSKPAPVCGSAFGSQSSGCRRLLNLLRGARAHLRYKVHL